MFQLIREDVLILRKKPHTNNFGLSWKGILSGHFYLARILPALKN